jgi:hypothetical protein
MSDLFVNTSDNNCNVNQCELVNLQNGNYTFDCNLITSSPTTQVNSLYKNRTLTIEGLRDPGTQNTTLVTSSQTDGDPLTIKNNTQTDLATGQLNIASTKHAHCSQLTIPAGSSTTVYWNKSLGGWYNDNA